MHTVTRFVVLLDGPATLQQVRNVADCAIADSARVSVAHYGRNEHFVSTGATEMIKGEPASIYTWTHSTAIAE